MEIGKPDFDRLAPFYDTLARGAFGSSIQKIQLDLLLHIPPNASVLVLGGGTGWILSSFFDENPVERLVFLDASPKMLGLALGKLEALSPSQALNVELMLGSEKSPFRPHSFDIILAPFFLDLFDQPYVETVIQRLDPALTSTGKWLVADFSPHNLFCKAALMGMYQFFGFATGLSTRVMPDIQKAFQNAQYQGKEISSRFGAFMKGYVFSQPEP